MFPFISARWISEQHNTITAVIQLMELFYNEVDKHNKVLASFMDLSTAFDRINHSMLRDKLEKYDLREHINKSLMSYVSRRSNCRHKKHISSINGSKNGNSTGLNSRASSVLDFC